jgi:hypothetical protein
MKNTTLEFITVISPSGHQSSLSIGGRQDKGFLVVVGGLPHNAEFKPASKADCKKLIKALSQMNTRKLGDAKKWTTLELQRRPKLLLEC